MKSFFHEHVQEQGSFLGVLRQVLRLHFPEFTLFTYFPLKISYYSTSIAFNVVF